jgi:2-polyprenyl-6-hydroxyphenyl methylase/3-demethylubiquinone-9 3-methyltransferase
MSNLDSDERDKFSSLAARWWDVDGPCRTLHDINPCRLDYIADSAELDAARVADIGCGGGVLSAALATRGARVTAIDASSELVAVARAHARENGLDIDYRQQMSAALAEQATGQFDLVTCMELIEHVPDPDALLADCANLLKTGGQLIVSTLNRTAAAYVLGIVAAEYVFGLVPRGTHDYAHFLRPSELANCARTHGLKILDVRAMHYNPVTRKAQLGGNPKINYVARFERVDTAGGGTL